MLTEIPEVKLIHDTKTKIYFHKKTAPQLSGHIGLQNMKVRVKTNFQLLTPSLSWIAGKY